MEKRTMKWIVVLFLVALVGAFLWAAGGIQAPGHRQGKVIDYAKEKPDGFREITRSLPRDLNHLVVMSWNIHFGNGDDADRDFRMEKDPEILRRRLDRMAELIRRTSADIVLMQEIDFEGSRRAGGIDQLDYLAAQTGLRYGAKAVGWVAGHVPYPSYFSLHDQYGKVRSGGAVLSRFPIHSNQYDLLEKPAEYPWWYRLFYLFRYQQTVEVEVDGSRYSLVNVHLEAFKEKNREQHAQKLVEKMNGLLKSHEAQSAPLPLLFCGDFNSIPVAAKNRTTFADVPPTETENYENDQTLATIDTLTAFKEVVLTKEYAEHEDRYFTFPARAPNRRLDFIYVHRSIDVLHAEVIQTDDLSDHLPVLATLRLKNSKKESTISSR